VYQAINEREEQGVLDLLPRIIRLPIPDDARSFGNRNDYERKQSASEEVHQVGYRGASFHLGKSMHVTVSRITNSGHFDRAPARADFGHLQLLFDAQLFIDSAALTHRINNKRKVIVG
jgi:hypothetical protein